MKLPLAQSSKRPWQPSLSRLLELSYRTFVPNFRRDPLQRVRFIARLAPIVLLALKNGSDSRRSHLLLAQSRAAKPRKRGEILQNMRFAHVLQYLP